MYRVKLRASGNCRSTDDATVEGCGGGRLRWPRKIGTVGYATGVELAVIDDGGVQLRSGRSGEVVVRGPSVMRGYHNNPTATKAAFSNGWLRSGDIGVLDSDGYLTLTGRIKAMCTDDFLAEWFSPDLALPFGRGVYPRTATGARGD